MDKFWLKSGLIFFATIYIIVGTRCSSTQQEKTGEKKSAREKIEEYQNREAKNLSSHSVQNMPDASMVSEGEISVKKIDEKSWYFSIPIGGESSMECSLLEGNQSPTYILRNLYERIRSNKSLNEVSIKNISTGVVSRLPYIYLETEYLTNEKLYGIIKSISISSIGFVLMCYHDELGYHKTFNTVAESFATSEKIQKYLKNIKNYRKRDIQEIIFNDQVIGFTENFLFTKNGKELNYYTISNYLIPRGNELMAGELIEDLYAETENGNITSGKYYSYKNDLREYEISLSEISSGNYRAQGFFRNEKISQDFHPDQKILSLDFVLDKIIKENKEKKDNIIKIYQYHASYPDQLPLSELKVQSLSASEGKFTFNSGPVSMEIEADQKGISLVTVISQNARMLTRKIFSESQ